MGHGLLGTSIYTNKHVSLSVTSVSVMAAGFLAWWQNRHVFNSQQPISSWYKTVCRLFIWLIQNTISSCNHHSSSSKLCVGVGDLCGSFISQLLGGSAQTWCVGEGVHFWNQWSCFGITCVCRGCPYGMIPNTQSCQRILSLVIWLSCMTPDWYRIFCKSNFSWFIL